MRVKKFQAKDMAEAMKMVKTELGSQAVILHSRDMRKGLLGWFMGGGVEVTAAVDMRKNANAETTPSLRPSPDNKKNTGGKVDFKVSDRKEKNTPPKQKTPQKPPANNEDVNPLLALSQKLMEENQNIKQQNTAPNGKSKSSHNPQSSNSQQPINNKNLEKRLEDMENKISKLTSLIENLAPSLASGDMPSVPSRTRDIYNHLLEQEVDESLALSIASQIAESTDENDDVWTALKSYFVSRINVSPSLELDMNAKRPKVIMLVGPTGVGKTTTLAKISAQYRYAKNAEKRPKIVFITADLYRLAAVEQLQKYTEILGVELEVTYSAEEVRQALKKHQNANLILFDTAGSCQRNLPQMSTLASIVESALPTEVHLVLSSTTKFGDLIDIVEHFKNVKPNRLLFTKIDESTTVGPLFNTLEKYKIPLSYLTTGQNVPEDIEPARAERIAKMLMTKPVVNRSITMNPNDSNVNKSDSHSADSMNVSEKQDSKQDNSDETKNA